MTSPIRLGLFYSALFVGTGAAMPYIPVWMASRGLSGAEIGIILSAPMIARIVTGPAIAMWADGLPLRRTSLILLSIASAAAYSLMAAPFGFWWWLTVWFCAASMLANLAPLADIIVLRRAREGGFHYGWPRGIGSVAFIVANIGAGILVSRYSSELVIPWIVACALLTAAAGRWMLPPDPVVEDGVAATLAARVSAMRGLLKDKTFLLTIGSVGMIQSSHAFYYGFSVLAWKQQGIAENMTGVLWGVAVAVEVGFMWFMEPWRRALGAHRLLILGGAAAVVRWALLALSPPLWLLFPVQALHALSYAATFMASLQLVERLSTSANASAAQTLNSALSVGALSGLATIAAGKIFDEHGALGYLVMSALAIIGVAGAVQLHRGSK